MLLRLRQNPEANSAAWLATTSDPGLASHVIPPASHCCEGAGITHTLIKLPVLL